MTVDRHTHELARPFIVVATQNPVEYEGTYPLPEAQLDRFMVRVSLGYPSAEQESADAASTTPRATACSTSSPWPTWPTCSPRRRPRARCTAARRCAATWSRSSTPPAPTRAWTSARARAPGLMLFRAAKALAALDARDHALPDDVQELAGAVLAHRLLLSPGHRRRRARHGRARRAGAGPGALTRLMAARSVTRCSAWRCAWPGATVRHALAVRARRGAVAARPWARSVWVRARRAAGRRSTRMPGPHTVVEDEPYPLRVEVRERRPAAARAAS